MASGEISTERATALVEEIATLKPNWIIIEGGEPLLRTDLFDLLNIMKQKQLDTYLISNGMLLTPEIITTLASLSVKLNLSIDGACASSYEAIRCGAVFTKVLSNARNCVTAGILKAINFTVMKANYTEIPGIFEIAQSFGVNQINLIGFKPRYTINDDFLSPSEYLEAINLACNAAQKTGVGFFFDEPFFHTVVRNRGLSIKMPPKDSGIVSSSTTACLFGEYIFIETNGNVKPCSFTSMTVGNIDNSRLDVIWHDMLDSPILQRIKEPKNRTGQCGTCSYVADCKGCRSRTFMITGDWFASDPCCPLSSGALEAGVH
jgi:radical SAM protein with 4Fe4S-binding SPASM domain